MHRIVSMLFSTEAAIGLLAAVTAVVFALWRAAAISGTEALTAALVAVVLVTALAEVARLARRRSDARETPRAERMRAP
ncbi:MAG TPA: hypothetical protein VI997_05160 [Candidatus Thermoplasmatota archaeon]|nr:hypothetical protein [Candidatus Thermoplasmatota archaeon]